MYLLRRIDALIFIRKAFFLSGTQVMRKHFGMARIASSCISVFRFRQNWKYIFQEAVMKKQRSPQAIYACGELSCFTGCGRASASIEDCSVYVDFRNGGEGDAV
ncbi:MAG: hypothetical protein LBD80_09885, partial [Tannerella sp.]|jgi:hypothetical protein|nr:hypothetical protein [Tannerella sp.]